jgi:hypothetical protein
MRYRTFGPSLRLAARDAAGKIEVARFPNDHEATIDESSGELVITAPEGSQSLEKSDRHEMNFDGRRPRPGAPGRLRSMTRRAGDKTIVPPTTLAELNQYLRGHYR